MTPKPGARALGVAESVRGDRSTLAGAVVRADRVVDGAAFGSCTVGGLDATDAVVDLVADLDREDVRYLLVGAVAPAWYNILDLGRLRDETGLPTIAVTFEASNGLEASLREAFSGTALDRRLERYRSLPPRRELRVNDETVYVRGLGLSEAAVRSAVRTFTPVGGRPEPIRVAKLLARAGAAFVE